MSSVLRSLCSYYLVNFHAAVLVDSAWTKSLPVAKRNWNAFAGAIIRRKSHHRTSNFHPLSMSQQHLSPGEEGNADEHSLPRTPFWAVSFAHDATSLTDGILLTPQFSCIHTKSDPPLITDSPEQPQQQQLSPSSATKTSLASSVSSRPPVILPWMGFGTYKLANQAEEATYQAIVDAGYRHIDTAFIYSRQRTEGHVGLAIQRALQENPQLRREHLFITTKQWRSYHGYEPTNECLALSLERLQLDYIDLWLMHWPGPAWKPRNYPSDKDGDDKNNGDEDEDDVWNHAQSASSAADMQTLRAETWRAMEDAYLNNKVRAIGVCNFSVAHLQALEETCRIRPMVNQVELHPLYPQTELLQYCRDKGIVVQAYASLGGQDTTIRDWQALWKTHPPHDDPTKEDDEATHSSMASQTSPKNKNKNKRIQKKGKSPPPPNLLSAPPVQTLANSMNQTPGQILLQWALSQNCVVIPKSSQGHRMRENAQSMSLPRLSNTQIEQLSRDLLDSVAGAKPTSSESKNNKDSMHEQDTSSASKTRLCWRGDRLRMLDF